MLDFLTYLCEPYSAWQRGKMNTSRVSVVISRKGSDFTAVTNEELEDIVHEMNKRPWEFPD